jgi:hypothetical protein
MLIGFFNCQKENLSIDIKQDLKTQTSTTKTVSARDIPEVMSFIASKSSDYKFLLDDSTSEEGMNRSHEDNLVMTELITDQITQVTNAYQKSNYTFRLIKQSGADGNYFLNLVVKEYKDTFYLYIVKYVPDTFWLSTHSITNDLGDFTGHIYYYSDQGIYVANVTMQNGSSTSSSYNPCPDDTDDGIDIPDDDGTGGGGELECTVTTVWYECSGTDAAIPHSAESCGAQNGPQTGSGWIVTWECEFNYSANNLNDVLRNPCQGGSGGGGNTSCQPDPNNPCEIPYTLDETCECVLAEAIENDEVVVVTPKEEFITDLIEDSIISTNLDPCAENILNDLKNLTSDISDVLARFGNVTSVYNWEIKSGTPSNSNNVAETNWSEDENGYTIDNSYLTLMNTNYINQATNLAIARTILHEAIHAYILSFIEEFLDDPQVNQENFQNNFPEVWDFFVAKSNNVDVGNIEDAHHEQMAATFIDSIGSALAEYDNNQQDMYYYYYLAWGALFETNAWNTVTSFYDYEEDPYSIVDAIIIANQQEDTNGLNAFGEPCN